MLIRPIMSPRDRPEQLGNRCTCQMIEGTLDRYRLAVIIIFGAVLSTRLDKLVIGPARFGSPLDEVSRGRALCCSFFGVRKLDLD
jgi:hypothetical protein